MIVNVTSSNFSVNISNVTSMIVDGEINLDFAAGLKICVSVLCVMMLIVGTLGNLLVPMVVWRNRDMRNSTNVFLVNLSFADLLVLIICVPTVLVELNSKPETWVLGKTMCKMVPFLESTVAHGSVLTILAISFERYYAICQPLRAVYKCTKTRATIIIVIVWIVSAIVTSPVIATTEFFEADYIDNSTVMVCVNYVQTSWKKTYYMSMQIVFFVLPLIILIVVYSIITGQLMEATTLPSSPRSSMKNIKPDHHTIKARKQVVATLIAVVTSFFVCLLPIKVFKSWVIFTKTEDIQKIGATAYYNLLFAARMMLYVNSMINPILYNVISSKFREAFLRQIRCKSKFEYTRKNTFLTTSSTTAGRYSLTKETLNQENTISLTYNDNIRSNV